MIVDEAVKRILSMIDIREPGGELIEVDDTAGEGIVIPAPAVRVVESMTPHPETVRSEGEEVLGTYQRMSSPGRISLNWQSIGSLFWHTVLDMQQHSLYIEQRDLEPMASVVVHKTYLHEGFHHFTDVAQRLFGGKYDHDMEEALAVACSHKELAELYANARSKVSRLSGLLYRELVSRIFQYSGAGYCDWVNFQTVESYTDGLVYYVNPPDTGFLMSSGVDVGAILLAVKESVSDQSKVIEQLVP